MIQKGLIQSNKKKKKIIKSVYYSLTDAGTELAYMHHHLHQKVIERYEELLHKFDGAELTTIIRFMSEWTDQIKNTDMLE